MNESNRKDENVLAAPFPLPHHKAESIPLPLALFHSALCPSPLPFPLGKRFGHGIDRLASQPRDESWSVEKRSEARLGMVAT